MPSHPQAVREPTHTPWWRDAVCYQIYIRSFADSDGDGLGDLPGITSRLPYLRDLGVDALWITPFYPSPQHDHGYDVADYCDVDPLFGRLADFDEMLATAHGLGLKVIVDLVPNHTSMDHPWFQAALAAEPGSPERDRYIFRPGRGRGGAKPPNNWTSVFGGPAWTRLPEGLWYLHLFDSTQPDLNWANPEIAETFDSILRFWLDRGVDGFRVDVAHGLHKSHELPDTKRGEMLPMWDHPHTHEVYQRWRRILDEYEGDRMAVAEVWVDTPEKTAKYIRADELNQAFNFHWLTAPWSAAAFRKVIGQTLDAVAPVHGSPTWVLSNHDVTRHVTRYGGGDTGRARGRAAVLTMLALPGSAYVYQGEELGLDQVEVHPEDRQDPAYFRGGEPIGRDGCRVPIPWSGARVPYGFGPGRKQPWLPQPEDWAGQTASAQELDPASDLHFYRAALAARREHLTGRGPNDRHGHRSGHRSADDVTMLSSAPGSLAFRRGGAEGVVSVVNCGSRPVRLPAEAGELLLASSPAALVDGRLAPDSAAWFTASRPS